MPSYSNSDRLNFLHTTNCDSEGYEWGVARIKFENGRAVSTLWTNSDSSDLDKVMEEHRVKPRISAEVTTCALGHVFGYVAGHHPLDELGQPRCPRCLDYLFGSVSKQLAVARIQNQPPAPNSHNWAGDGERCADCGESDWYAGNHCQGPKKDPRDIEGVGAVLSLNPEQKT